MRTYNLKQLYLERTGQSWYDSDLLLALKTIEERHGVTPSSEGPWLAGGCLRRALSGVTIREGDLDFFYPEDEVVKFDKEQMEITENVDTPPVLDTKVDMWKMQQIFYKRFANVEAILDQFDLTIVCFAFDGEMLFTQDSALKDLDDKVMRLNNLTNPSGTFKRILRYEREGFRFADAAVDPFIDKTCKLGNVKDKYAGS